MRLYQYFREALDSVSFTVHIVNKFIFPKYEIRTDGVGRE